MQKIGMIRFVVNWSMDFGRKITVRAGTVRTVRSAGKCDPSAGKCDPSAGKCDGKNMSLE